MNCIAADLTRYLNGIVNFSIRIKMRGIKPMRSLDYFSGSVQLYDFEDQNQSLTDLREIPEKGFLFLISKI